MSTSNNNENDENERVVRALERLQVSLQELPSKQDPPTLSHWRRLPESVQAAYDYAKQGSELCHATATKYTLVGKIDANEGAKLAKELLRGCELIATGALVICNDDQGCSQAARHYIKQAARAIVASTLQLVQVFEQHLEHSTDNIAAQHTGAVWNTCDSLLKIPNGNRNAIRRELFSFIQDANETIEEFTEMIEQGPSDGSNGIGGSGTLNTVVEEQDDNDATANNDTSWDDFLQGDTDQYSENELPVATASLCLVKCSRGSMNMALKACESVGAVIERETSESEEDDMSTQARLLLEWILKLTVKARRVGNGITDLGTCLYPPLQLYSDNGSDEQALQVQLAKQRDAIIDLNGFVLDFVETEMPEEVTELASKLKAAATTRYEEANTAINAALEAGD